MAGTKRRRPTEQAVLRWIKQGYGQGCGPNYKPLLYVRDVPSSGSSNMVQSQITGRIHHYLSEGEFQVHLLAEHSPKTVDIREQFALLPWSETQWWAKKLGIKHPIYPGTSVPVLMSTDLLISLKEPDGVQLVAISVKQSSDLDKRTLEKLLLERVYWNRRGINWLLITEKDIPQPRAKNLAFFEIALREAISANIGVDASVFSEYFQSILKQEQTYIEALSSSCQRWGLSNNDGHLLLSTAIWRHQSRIDIDATEISHNQPLCILKDTSYVSNQRDICTPPGNRQD